MLRAQLVEFYMAVDPSKLKDVGATMTEEWLAKAGDNGKTLVEAYRAN